ncbi:MAG: hypothetical protein DSY42_00505 [Aquifex sp.]|nr:MAG: hypothetical protein DSY42_00505 [Aquifex sp.]
MLAIEELKKLKRNGRYCVSLRKASKILGMHPSTLKNHILKDRIKAKILEIDGKTRYLIDVDSLIEFVESGY